VDFVHRWLLKTPYTATLKDVAAILAMPLLNYPTLVIDQTVVGKAVVDIFRDAHLNSQLEAVVVTGGHDITTGMRATSLMERRCRRSFVPPWH
jgi:hypothetical protein